MLKVAAAVAAQELLQTLGIRLAEAELNLVSQINMHVTMEILAVIVQLETAHYTAVVLVEEVPELQANRLKDMLLAVKAATAWPVILVEH
jgi:hypothetical protein